MKASGLHSILRSSDDGNTLKSLKQVTTLSVNGGVESTFYLFFIAFMQQASK